MAANTTAKRSYGANDPTSLRVEEWPEAKLAIYEAALDLFCSRGFAETSVADIAARANLTKGAIYHYFESKNVLLRICTQRGFITLIPTAKEIAARDISAADALTAIVQEVIRAIELYRREVTLFLEELPRGENPELEVTHRLRDEYEQITVGIIERGIANGEFQPLAPPRVIAFALFGMTTNTRLWWRPNSPMTAREVSDFFSKLFLSGLMTTPSQPHGK
jgi:TetR/AcrR family transcriptional regulator, cholesterol catabolism regulator